MNDQPENVDGVKPGWMSSIWFSADDHADQIRVVEQVFLALDCNLINHPIFVPRDEQCISSMRKFEKDQDAHQLAVCCGDGSLSFADPKLIRMVVDQTACGEQAAAEALQRHAGDVVGAIMYLMC